jgi:hypothetical protein
MTWGTWTDGTDSSAVPSNLSTRLGPTSLTSSVAEPGRLKGWLGEAKHQWVNWPVDQSPLPTSLVCI